MKPPIVDPQRNGHCIINLSTEDSSWDLKILFPYYNIILLYTRSEARFARLLLDCELSYCFHWVIVVVGGRVHEWCKKGSGIL